VHLILRALNGVGLNRIEGRTKMLDWTLDVYIYRFSFSCPWVTIFLHSRELKLPVGYDISPLKRVKFNLTLFEWRNIVTHGQLKKHLFLPLFNTNFISITDLTTCGERHKTF
jgi:hypothetical protein